MHWCCCQGASRLAQMCQPLPHSPAAAAASKLQHGCTVQERMVYLRDRILQAKQRRAAAVAQHEHGTVELAPGIQVRACPPCHALLL